MSTEEKKEVIALFMGLERTEKESGEHTFKQEKNSVVWASQLKYDSSWDWLMPVILKAKRTPNSANWDDWNMLNTELLKCDLWGCFSNMVRFIEWHNSNVKNK